MNKTPLRLIAVALATATLAGVAAPAMAQTAYPSYRTYEDRDEARFAPPQPRAEAAPPTRPGFIWTQGHWDWQGDRYVWQSGRWERDRSGYVYQPARWVPVGDHWEFRQAQWVPDAGYRQMRDRDGDGVPNRLDRYPDNPHRS